MTLLVRVDGDGRAIAPSLRAPASELDPAMPLRTLENDPRSRQRCHGAGASDRAFSTVFGGLRCCWPRSVLAGVTATVLPSDDPSSGEAGA
jgi:hypothetical protein